MTIHDQQFFLSFINFCVIVSFFDEITSISSTNTTKFFQLIDYIQSF